MCTCYTIKQHMALQIYCDTRTHTHPYLEHKLLTGMLALNKKNLIPENKIWVGIQTHTFSASGWISLKSGRR